MLVAVGVLAVVLAVMGIVRLADPPGEGEGGGAVGTASGTAPGGGSSGSTGTGSPAEPLPSAAPGGDAQQTRFTAVAVGADGDALDVSFWGGVDTCYRYAVRADESERGVALSLSEDRTTDGPCIDLAQQYDRTVRLDKPLGDRRVIDAATGEVVLPGPNPAR